MKIVSLNVGRPRLVMRNGETVSTGIGRHIFKNELKAWSENE